MKRKIKKGEKSETWIEEIRRVDEKKKCPSVSGRAERERVL